MKLTKNKTTLSNYAQSLPFEWIETNGLGGYASSTLTGTNTRCYHGLLVVSMKPPVERIAMLSKMDETIFCTSESGTERFDLGTNQYKGAVNPLGFNHIKRFTRDLFPEWIYQLPNGIEIKKTIATVQDENTTLVVYEVLKAKNSFTMELMPLVSGRDFHALTHANDALNPMASFENNIFCVKPYTDLPELLIAAEGATFSYQPCWYNNFEYLEEINRGLDGVEDLFTYGKFTRQLKKGDTYALIISTTHPANRNALDLFKQEKSRKEKITAASKTSLEKILALAADQFVVQRAHDLKTIIAGYHWFSDWGRDTMISLPGLCLSTGRYTDAQKILSAFAQSVNQGMLPNRFPDNGELPEYNTVDATLWFFIAIQKYLDATKDKKFVLEEMLPVLKDIVQWHFKGMRYHIHVAADGLLYQGTEGQQLTWMDARVGNWVVTPRMGKAVEINALWYNALVIYSGLLKLNSEKENAQTFSDHALQVKLQFTSLFWNPETQCLYDFVINDYKDASIRPNQLFAVSLPHALVDGEKAASILNTVTQHLYTPVGLRSLTPNHPDYRGFYNGDQLARDGAYHQGTVWSWLLGPYIDALIKVKGAQGKAEAKKVIQSFSFHLNEAGIGTVSEIFDGNAPHTPRGCIAQAWGVGELLRVISDYDLMAVKKTTSKKVKVKP